MGRDPHAHSFAAASCWYGGGIAGTKDERPNCPVQMHFGEKDASIPMTDVDAIRAAQPKVESYVYMGAGHGFGCDERGSFSKPDYELAQSARWRSSPRISSDAYRPTPAARRARGPEVRGGTRTPRAGSRSGQPRRLRPGPLTARAAGPGLNQPGPRPRRIYGSSTWSITWITPFDWVTSATVISATPPFASFTIRLLDPFIVTVIG